MILTILYGILASIVGVLLYVLYDVAWNKKGPQIKTFSQFDFKRYWRTNQVRLVLIMIGIVMVAVIAHAMKSFVDQWVAMFISLVGGTGSTVLSKKVSSPSQTITGRMSLFKRAGEYLGIYEAPGDKDNPEIVGWAKKMGFTQYTHDSIAWCALFVNWILFMCGYPILKSLRARDFINYGMPATAADIASGNVIAVFKRHVGFPEKESEDGKKIYLRGGNQSNGTNDMWFDKVESEFLGYRKVA